MSFVLIYKATQVVNFAQGEFLLIGAWVCWWLLTKYQLPFYLGMPVTLVSCSSSASRCRFVCCAR